MSSIVYVKLKTEVRVNERCSGPTFGRQREITESRRTEHRGPPDRQARAHRTVITRWWKPDSFSPSQWKELPIERDHNGCPEIHYTRIYRAFRQWEADGCIDAIFADVVMQLHQDALLDLTV